MKEGILNGLASDPEVPILSGDMLDLIINSTQGDINKIWKIISEESFLPREGRHYSIGRVTPIPSHGRPFNGVRFGRTPLLPVLGEEQWHPGRDIDFS